MKHTFILLLALSSLTMLASGREGITTPREQFGFAIGDDYCLANYVQLSTYWKKLEQESDRMRLEVIGPTEEGRDILMAILTSPENHRHLDRYKDIARRLALAEDLEEDTARALAREGKAVVWIDGGLHASEVLVAQQLIETVYQLCAFDDEETLRFLDDLIILCCCPNPDGLDLVSDWYMRHEDPEMRSSRHLPRLYQKYTGHDNNRDFFMITQKETEALCRIFYHEWFPQIIYNHHQTGPAGTVLFAPPFRGPFNHNYDPLVPIGIDLVGAAMHSRFLAEGKKGATMRRGASYSTWWNGGLRTNAYFHNMIGLLTETIGHPTPMEIPLRLSRQLSTMDLPAPIAPQKWHFRQSVEYSLTANRAVLDVASRFRESFLYNIYRMGRNSIERGNRDHWTIRPHRLEEVIAMQEERRKARRERKNGEGAEVEEPDLYKDVLHDPAHRDARGYILPADQPDFLTATKFVNTLIKGGIAVHRATAWFEVDGKPYPEGSYVVKTAQAFRPHILDMFEPQDHPDDIPVEGAPPIPPYDSAGWTLAYQMGVRFDRILDGFEGPFERLRGSVKPPPGSITLPDQARGFYLSHATNDSFLATNRLLKSGETVAWTESIIDIDGHRLEPGTLWIPKRGGTLAKIRSLAEEYGLNFIGSRDGPGRSARSLAPVRVGLWDRYGGSKPSGWLRWILEQFEFDFDVVYAPDLDKGNLIDNYDCLIFVSGAIPNEDRRRRWQPNKEDIPEEYHDRLGSITIEKTIPELKTFLHKGGTILTIGSSTILAQHLDLPIRNALEERQEDGTTTPIPRTELFVPGSILDIKIAPHAALTYGVGDRLDIYFRRSPVFRLPPDASQQGMRALAWFDTDTPLRSGWAWGQHRLRDGVMIVEAEVGHGGLVLYGPEITFRAQPHASFKLLFNGIYYGAYRAPRLEIGRAPARKSKRATD